jgi:lipopolysaccharide export LptBFGC system permease protein LptF
MFSNQRIAIAAIIVGLLAAAALMTWPWARRAGRFAVAGLAAALGFAAWNATLNLTNGTGFNVDAPVVRVSWQDAGSAVLAFAVTALALGLSVARDEPARHVIGAAALAGLVVLVFDIFGF